MAFDEDLDTFFEDFGEPLVHQGQTVTGNVSVATEDFVADDQRLVVRGETITFRFPVSALRALPKSHDQVTLRGKAYRVRHTDMNTDGSDATLYLEAML